MTSRIEKYIGNHVVIHDNDRSGAILAWHFFHPGTEVPMLIRHIDDRDRWQFKLEGSKELHAALASYKPWSFEQWRMWQSDTARFDGKTSVEWLIDEGTTLLRAQDAAVASMMKQARKCRISTCSPQHGPDIGEQVPPSWSDGYLRRFDGLACNSQLHASELGDELANVSGTFGLVWYVGEDNKVKCSLRSNGDYDVSAIARAFGGGGHRNAAGFQTDIETLMGWLS